MADYRIHRLKESQRQAFRWAPHASGVALAKPKDYEEPSSAAAVSPYELWARSRETERPLAVGDILELENEDLRIVKYIGFEEARWVLPESKPALEPAPAGADGSIGG